ncbi:MAG: tyrosine recombinase XerD [Chloroflexota bacterium]
MEEQLDAFLRYLSSEKGCSENTTAAYRNDLSQFIHFLTGGRSSDQVHWAQVDRDRVIAYVIDLKQRQYAPSTVARKIAALKSFFRFLIARGQLAADPTSGLDAPHVERHLPRPLSADDVARLLDAPPKTNAPKALRDRALLELLYASGMRVSEAVNLRLADVDLATCAVRCSGWGGRERLIPIDARVCQSLATYIEKGRPALVRDPQDEALFLNHRGQKLTRQGLWLIIKAYAEAAQIQGEVTPHTLRHSFAAHRLTSGADVNEVQQLLGHANPATTQVYVQVARSATTEAL